MQLCCLHRPDARPLRHAAAFCSLGQLWVPAHCSFTQPHARAGRFSMVLQRTGGLRWFAHMMDVPDSPGTCSAAGLSMFPVPLQECGQGVSAHCWRLRGDMPSLECQLHAHAPPEICAH